MNDDGVDRCGEKEKKERKNEGNLLYLGLCYFSAIFELKLSF